MSSVEVVAEALVVVAADASSAGVDVLAPALSGVDEAVDDTVSLEEPAVSDDAVVGAGGGGVITGGGTTAGAGTLTGGPFAGS